VTAPIEAGQRFGLWTVVEKAPRRQSRNWGAYWICRCDCGTVKPVSKHTLQVGESRSCGCVVWRDGEPAPKPARTPLTPEQWALVVGGRDFAKRFARKVCLQLSAPSMVDDAMSEGLLAIIRAAQDYDPSRGSFEGYAGWWIRMYVQRFVAQHRHAVEPARTGAGERAAIKVSRYVKQREALTGERVTYEDAVAALGLPPGAAEWVRMSMRGPDKPIAPCDAWEDGAHTPQSHEPGPDVAAEGADWAKVQRATIDLALRALQPVSREVVQRRYLNDPPETLAEIGAALGLTRERVRQIEAAALRDMAKRMKRTEVGRVA
jgi:RNA polymerase sigma-32 factor